MQPGASAGSRQRSGDVPSGRVITANAMFSFLSPAGTSTTLPIVASAPLAEHPVDVAWGVFDARAARLVPPTTATDALAAHPTSLSTVTVSSVGVAHPSTSMPRTPRTRTACSAAGEGVRMPKKRNRPPRRGQP